MNPPHSSTFLKLYTGKNKVRYVMVGGPIGILFTCKNFIPRAPDTRNTNVSATLTILTSNKHYMPTATASSLAWTGHFPPPPSKLFHLPSPIGVANRNMYRTSLPYILHRCFCLTALLQIYPISLQLYSTSWKPTCLPYPSCRSRLSRQNTRPCDSLLAR